MNYWHTWDPLPISTWIEIFLVFSLQVGPQSALMIVVFYVPEIEGGLEKNNLSLSIRLGQAGV